MVKECQPCQWRRCFTPWFLGLLPQAALSMALKMIQAALGTDSMALKTRSGHSLKAEAPKRCTFGTATSAYQVDITSVNGLPACGQYSFWIETTSGQESLDHLSWSVQHVLSRMESTCCQELGNTHGESRGLVLQKCIRNGQSSLQHFHHISHSRPG